VYDIFKTLFNQVFRGFITAFGIINDDIGAIAVFKNTVEEN